MKKIFVTTLLYCLFVNTSILAEISNTNMSKSELCDVAIQELEKIIKQSPDGANQPAITKEQCMAISDDDINNTVKKMMANGSK